MVERLEAYAAGAADRFVQRTRAQQRQRQALDRRRQAGRLGIGGGGGEFTQEAGPNPIDAQLAAQVIGHRPGAARASQGCLDLLATPVRQQVQPYFGRAPCLDPFADGGGEGIDQAALDTVAGHDEFALARRFARQSHGHRFDRSAGELVAKQLAPAVDLETAIAWPQGLDLDATGAQQGHPGAVGAQALPTAATERQDHGVGAYRQALGGALDVQRTVRVPAQPTAAGVDEHALLAQALEPGTEQRGGLHVGGEHPAGTADEGVDTQAVDPGAQRIRVEFAEQCGDFLLAPAIAAEELFPGLGMGDVHAADAREEEFPADRGHGVEHFRAYARLAQDLRGHQACGTAADDGDLGGRGGCLTGHVDDERDLGKPACSVTEAKTASEPCRCHLVRSPCAWSGTDQPSQGQARCAARSVFRTLSTGGSTRFVEIRRRSSRGRNGFRSRLPEGALGLGFDSQAPGQWISELRLANSARSTSEPRPSFCSRRVL